MTESLKYPPENFLNRELQWLEFNHRVLNEAKDPRTPLLERLAFLGIVTSNLDEFVMKRVGGLMRQVSFGVNTKSHDGKLPAEQLKLIRAKIEEQSLEASVLYKGTLVKELSTHRVYISKWKDLSKAGQEELRQYYRENIFPVLTPLVVDTALPFPFISNLSLSLAVKLRSEDKAEEFFARVKIPEIFPQWLEVKSESKKKQGYVFVSLVQVIQNNIQDLFPGTEVANVMPFRITRNADLERDEDEAEDLLDLIVEELKQRRFAEVVRLEHGVNPDPWMLELLKQELDLTDGEVFEVAGLLDYTSLKPVVKLPLPHLKYNKFDPKIPIPLNDTQSSVFELIKKGDILVHHPFDSFSASVERFIREATRDPKVLAIKMTLYRTGDNSAVVQALMRAAEQGKQVVCLVELKARFDEQRNIHWAQQMEKVGVHVVYGVLGLKTHSKTTLVLRQEGQRIKAYAHIGSGNYNSLTAKAYTDLGLLTAREDITSDMVQLFHYLTGRSEKRTFNELLVAPMTMKQTFLKLIESEKKAVKKGKPARIVGKFNQLEDREIIAALYAASQAGVKIDLLVRGYCCLRPKVKNLSENINVYSVVGRFLEHSRVWFFQAGGAEPVEGKFFMGSADWMYRNLHRRVEVITPILDRSLKRRTWDILDTYLKDRRNLWEMKPDGTYKQRQGGAKGSQDKLMQGLV